MHKIHLLSVPWMLLASHSLLKHFSQMLSQLPGTFSSRLLCNRIVLHRQQLNPCSEPRGQAHLSPPAPSAPSEEGRGWLWKRKLVG